jgi:hypothetical protein
MASGVKLTSAVIAAAAKEILNAEMSTGTATATIARGVRHHRPRFRSHSMAGILS